MDNYDDTISYTRPSIELARARTKTIKQLEKEEEEDPVHHLKFTPPQFLVLGLHALGIIYGDIGTSPLYVLNTVFASRAPTKESTLGACSLIIWSLIIMVTLKYGVFVLNAAYHNQGGVFALCSYLVSKESSLTVTAKRVVVYMCIFGASLILGDGVITPAISVTSAIEGITIQSPELRVVVMPVTLVILVVLFFVQPFGTSKMGYAFGPIMLLWYLSLAGVGIWQLTMNPLSFVALNPWLGIKYFINLGPSSYQNLGGIFLAMTGVESLFADLGHFHQGPIRSTWLCIVLPCLILNYLGQTALLLSDPTKIDNPFYHSVPNPLFWPFIVLATLSGIIASQAVITGAFSIISQAVSLGYAPPLGLQQTSKKVEGQIYCPAINWIICVLTLVIVLWLQTSKKMTAAYGITVCMDMVLTSILLTMIMLFVWKYHIVLCLLFGVCALFFDVAFLGSIVFKIPDGGWVALVFTAIFVIPMWIWYTGEMHLRRYRRKKDPKKKNNGFTSEV